MLVGGVTWRAHRMPLPLAIAAISLTVGAAGLALTIPTSPELLSFVGYPVQQVERPANVVSESTLPEPETAPEALLAAEPSPLLAAAAVFASADASPVPLEEPATPPTGPPVTSPPATSSTAPTPPPAPVEAVSYGVAETIPAPQQSPTPATTPPSSRAATPGKTSTPTPTPASTGEAKRSGKSGDAPGKNKQSRATGTAPQPPGQKKANGPAGNEDKLAPGQAKKNQR